MVATNLNRLAVKIDEPILATELRDLSRSLVVAGNHVHLARTAAEDRPDSFQAALPTHQVARGKVVVGFCVHKPLQRFQIIVYVRENQYSHW